MNKCKKCSSYTRNNNPICYTCYINDGCNFVEGFKPASFEYSPLQYIKGHIGECIIRNLFSSMGFLVFRYGMENTMPQISEFLDTSDLSSNELSIIKCRPDLLILNREKKKIYFIEIKYRSSGEFKYIDLDENYKYTNAYIIIISKKGFKCIQAKELENTTQEELSKEKYNLAEIEEFNLDKRFVNLFEEQALNIYDSINKISHIKKKKDNKSLS